MIDSFLSSTKKELLKISPRNLSDREIEVLQLLAEGHSAKSTATILKLSSRTVESHRKKIGDKLGVKSAAGLTKWAIKFALTKAEP